MRYITKEEFQSLPSYPFIEEALFFGTGWVNEVEPITDIDALHKKKWPFTKSGYVAVQALSNLYRWKSWKSSSLSDEERGLSGAIGDLHLGALMDLNAGRRMNEPALFPEQDVLGEGR